MTLPELADAGFARNITGVCVAERRDGRWHEVSCDAFREQVRHFALGLHHLGIRHGDRVALHAENCAAWPIIDQAILALGATTVPIYTTQPPDQVHYILHDADARVYIYSQAALFDALQPYLPQLPGLQVVGVAQAPAAGLTMAQVLEQGRRREAERPDLLGTLKAAVRPGDLATLIYTSGTTGQPKGVMLTHHNIASNVLASLERMVFDPEAHRGHKVLSYLPLSHVLERVITFIYLHIGYPIYFVDDYQHILRDFQSVAPIHFSTVPRLLEKVYNGIKTRAATLKGVEHATTAWALRLAEQYDVERPMGTAERLQHALADRLVYRKLRLIFGANIKAITSGGAALAGPLMNFFNAVGIFCGQGYGMTETSPVVTTYKNGHLRAGSAGLAIDGVAVRIADDGEILVHGPNVMQGYHNAPEATAEVLRPDGWLHTGDIGHLDADGHLFITDRKKALFKLSTGKYVAPQPIETRLSASPLVDQVVVVGNQHKFCAALIVPDYAALAQHLGADGADGDALLAHAGTEPCYAGIVAAANAAAAPWEQVKAFRLLPAPMTVEGGELTPTLKVRRRVVHEKFGGLIASMYR